MSTEERKSKLQVSSSCIELVGQFEPLQRKRFSALGLVWSVIVECVVFISDKSEILSVFVFRKYNLVYISVIYVDINVNRTKYLRRACPM